MSQAKNVIEGMISLVEHLNSTHYKLALTQASLIGEFDEDTLRAMHDKIDRCRFRLLTLNGMVAAAIGATYTRAQHELLFNASAVPEPSAAIARDHRSNGSAD